MRRKSSYDLNSLIVFGNIAVCLISIYLYWKSGGNQYVNISTLILLCIFGIENFLMLLYEKKRRDPFVLLLLIVTLCFYMGRVATLLYDPWSELLAISSSSSLDLNYSLIFIMFFNFSIFLGLTMGGGNILYKEEDIPDNYPANSRNIILLLVIVMFLSYCLPAAGNFIGRFSGYICLFINLNLILLFTSVYLVINFNKISKLKRIVFLSLFTIFVLKSTLSGSRAALLAVVSFLLVAVLSVKGKIILNRRNILISLIIIPGFLIFFTVATQMRSAGISRYFSPIKQLALLKKAGSAKLKDVSKLCRPMFNRVAFLDYATLLIRNPQCYREVIKPAYYFKSIIDNVLTPGFTVFNTPRVSSTLKYISRGEPVPTQEQIMASPQSDMPTIYGEYYVFFYGYFALVIILISSFIFKKIYLSICTKDAFLFYLYRALVLYVFYLWINSFGVDWLLFDLISIIVTISLFKNFYKMRKRKVDVY